MPVNLFDYKGDLEILCEFENRNKIYQDYILGSY